MLAGYRPEYELSVDGHEKLSDKALQMGVVGFHIYGGRDKWSGKVLLLIAVPNSRFAEAIGHVYLDFVIEHGSMSFSPFLVLHRPLMILVYDQ